MSNWIIEPKLAQRIDDLMQEGYEYSAIHDTEKKVKVWLDVWLDLKKVMDEQAIPSLEDLDEALEGTQSISNWAMDLDMELHNVALADPAYHIVRITFCEEYIARSLDKLDSNVLEMQRCIAETYFDMGNIEEGERLFASLLASDPTNGWGWIGWADQYGSRAQEGKREYEKATQILLDALQVKDLEERSTILDRLADVYSERGMKAEEIQTRLLVEKEAKRDLKKIINSPYLTRSPLISVKIGRNDPCSCGSGKKYKKCCG
jgi:tetratricopeptide (TPR) repeat protein